MPEVKLAELFAAIGEAINEAQQAIGKNVIENYWAAYYRSALASDKDEDGIEPCTQKVILPTANHIRRAVDVPLLTLTHHTVMALDQVKIKLNVRAAIDEKTGSLKVTTASSQQNTEEGISGGVLNSEIEIVFKQEEVPEGVARITQEANKFI